MAIPEYADQRAHKHFHRGFVGSKHGDNGTQYSTSWDALSEAVPTTYHTYDNGHARVCVFCGNRPFPIQDHVGGAVLDYACVCPKAMDEVDWKKDFNALLMKQNREREELRKKAPKTNPEVLTKIVQRVTAKIVDEVERGWGHSELKRLGVNFNAPCDQFDKD